jgi:glucose-1-phosphate thymidylyltransferase
MAGEIDKAVILARGLGKRMRRADEGVALADEQARIAESGVKALIPVGPPEQAGSGRPFLDYVLSGLADAGLREICLVVGPEHDALRDYYTKQVRPKRFGLTFAVQAEPRGTADAVRAAREFAGDSEFLVMNSDTYYPVEAYRTLRELGRPGVIAFEHEALVRLSNIPAERVKQFAILRISATDELESVIEKPDESAWSAAGASEFVSMNIWRFGPRIFDACAAVKPSVRGELELPEAVHLAITKFGLRLRVVRMRAGVLDLSSRADILTVAERLRGVQVNL